MWYMNFTSTKKDSLREHELQAGEKPDHPGGPQSQELSPGLFFGIIPLSYSQAILEIIPTPIEWLGELYQVMFSQVDS